MDEDKLRDNLYNSINEYCFAHNDGCEGCLYERNEFCPLNKITDNILDDIK